MCRGSVEGVTLVFMMGSKKYHCARAEKAGGRGSSWGRSRMRIGRIKHARLWRSFL